MWPPTDVRANPAYRLLRLAELETVRPLLEPHFSVLEIGGGDGWQASLMTSWGYSVTSIDVEVPEGGRTCFPVQLYDGVSIPSPDEQFDLVFSSNVLEHVRDLPAFLTEVRRVLRKDGICVHLVPSVSWRLWSLLAHYALLPWFVGRKLARSIRRLLGPHGPERRVTGAGLGGSGSTPFLAKIRFVTGLQPHGEFPSSFGELLAFRKKSWAQRFECAGFGLVSSGATGLFCSGAWFILPLQWRRRLAPLLGSASSIFVMKKTP
jgi:SAM-dependent methyltransferase